VDWADEEGARFGASLLGSSLATGRLEPGAIADLRDDAGTRLEDALAVHGVRLAGAAAARARLEPLAAYLELHIEQGPVLEAEGLAVAAVSGTAGVERHVLTFEGRSGHAGTTPMPVRRDPLVAAARLAVAVRDAARVHGGVATVGALNAEPGIPTAVPGRVRLALDQRHPEAAGIAAMLDAGRADAARIAAEEGCTLDIECRFAAAPVGFDPVLTELAADACEAVAGTRRLLASGALHDATAVAGVVPTAMLFCSSTGGVSHAPDEDSPVEHIELAVRCLARLVELAARRA
jgi:N-carbamoyl-L-amino-acid hydrolase